jgi:predicted RNA-binding protein with PIN domain
VHRPAMPYLIDGNNLMALNVGWHRDRSLARKKLIYQLATFVSVSRAKVRVVFDGRPDDEFQEGTTYKSVRILYARSGSDADSRIKEIVRGASYVRDLTVVTSDRSLGSYVHQRGAKWVRSGAFRSILEQALVQKDAAESVGEATGTDVEEWIEYFEKARH